MFPRLEEEHGDKVVHSSHHLKNGTFLTPFQGWDILHTDSRVGHSSHHLKDGTFFTSFQGQWVSYFSHFSEKISEVDYMKDFSQGESSQCEHHGLAEGFLSWWPFS